MKTVIYKMNSYEVRKVVEGEVSFTDLKDDEDFIPLKMWNEGSESLGYPKIQE